MVLNSFSGGLFRRVLYVLTISTLSWGLSCSYASQKLPNTLIFEEDFNDQRDWTSTRHSLSSGQSIRTGHVMPENWDAIYQGTSWSPEKGFPDNHASLEILQKNELMARGYQGKSAVFWRESFSLGWRNWASDAQLIKILPDKYSKLYIEFWVRFSSEWYGRKPEEKGIWTSKIFRVGSWDGKGNIFNGAAGAIGPLFVWGWKKDSYGVRNVLTFRGGPHGENYSRLGEYGGSLNFSSHIRGAGYDGNDALLFDEVNGGFLVTKKGVIEHDQVFGLGSSWTKVAFYVEMNSSPGIKDGIMIQWINDVQIKFHNDIPWVMENENNIMVGWNYFSIGGNDYFQQFPNDLRYEDWYAIDDIKVLTKIPDNVKSSISTNKGEVN